MRDGLYAIPDYQKLHARAIHIRNKLAEVNLAVYNVATILNLT